MNSAPSSTICRATTRSIALMMLAIVVGANSELLAGARPINQLLPGQIATAKDQLKAGKKLNASDVSALAEGNVIEALPQIKQIFADPDSNGDTSIYGTEVLKQAAASATVRLGDKYSEAWDYLVRGVSEALGSTRPSSFNYGPDGKMLPEGSSKYSAYAKAHHMSEDDVLAEAENQTRMILSLASTHDKRAIPLLRRALSSNQSEIAIAASFGLAEIDDREAIPLIVDACNRVPRDLAAGLAVSLLLFYDPEADRAAKEFLPPAPAKSK